MCWVMPPASPEATSVSRIASSSDVLPWSTWPMIVITGGRSISSSSRVLVDRLLLHVVRRGVERDLLVEALGEHLDGLVGERLRERGHLAELHQLLDDLGGGQLERLGDLLDGRARADGDRRVLLERRGGCRRCLRLEIRLHPLGTAPAAAPAARRLLRRRRSAIAPRSLRIDYDAPAPASAAATAAAALAAAAAAGRARAAAARAAGRAAARTAGTASAARAAGPVGLGAAALGARGPGRLRGRSLLKNARAASLGTGALDLALGGGRARDRGPRLRLGLALGRALASPLAPACLAAAAWPRPWPRPWPSPRAPPWPSLRLRLGAVVLRLRVGLRRGLLRLRGRLRGTRAVAERLGGVGLVHARGCGRHLQAGLLERGQGILRGDVSFLRYLVDALLCHAVMKSKVSCCTVTGARKLRASGRPLSSLAAHSGLEHT